MGLESRTANMNKKENSVELPPISLLFNILEKNNLEQNKSNTNRSINIPNNSIQNIYNDNIKTETKDWNFNLNSLSSKVNSISNENIFVNANLQKTTKRILNNEQISFQSQFQNNPQFYIPQQELSETHSKKPSYPQLSPIFYNFQVNPNSKQNYENQNYHYQTNTNFNISNESAHLFKKCDNNNIQINREPLSTINNQNFKQLNNVQKFGDYLNSNQNCDYSNVQPSFKSSMSPEKLAQYSDQKLANLQVTDRANYFQAEPQSNQMQKKYSQNLLSSGNVNPQFDKKFSGQNYLINNPSTCFSEKIKFKQIRSEKVLYLNPTNNNKQNNTKGLKFLNTGINEDSINNVFDKNVDASICFSAIHSNEIRKPINLLSINPHHVQNKLNEPKVGENFGDTNCENHSNATLNGNKDVVLKNDEYESISSTRAVKGLNQIDTTNGQFIQVNDDKNTNNVIDVINANKGKNHKICPICNKICTTITRLKIHYLTHTKEKPYYCIWPNCKKSFNVNSNMKRHLKSHLNPRKCSKKGPKKLN